MKLWRSSLIFSAIQFIVGLGNLAFQSIISRQLKDFPGEFGYVTNLLIFIGLIGLPVTIVTQSLVHYIAHFRATNDTARLQGLLLGGRRLLLQVTVAGTILALFLTEPLSRFFEFPRSSLIQTALICVIVGLWSGFAMALCQGMGWFKRLALIGLVAAMMRIGFGWVVTKSFPVAEAAVSATTFSLLANFALLYWWKDIFKTDTKAISPWDRNFVLYLVMSAACVGGAYFFNSDQLVAQKYFHSNKEVLDNYTSAGILSRALIAVVGPILMVLFTSRSGSKGGSGAADQKIMLGLYAAGLICGAIALLVVRNMLMKVLGRYTPEASAMMIPFVTTMVFLGLGQAIGTWSLASGWFKLSIVYGLVGVSYWLALLFFGKTPGQLLTVMPIGAAIAFVIMLAGWFITTRNMKTAA